MQPLLTIKIFKTTIHSFHFFGTIGFVAGVILGVWLAFFSQLALWPLMVCALTGVSVLFGLTYLYKKITGKGTLVYYQHEIAILTCCLLILFLLNLPVLKYLDITLMGIGIFLAFGRIGCFSVGCCYGKIGKIGVKYTDAHVAEGFQKHFKGITIFPIQLVESGYVLITVLIGSFAIFNNYAPGTALLLYTIIYGTARFTLEYFRGDTARPYWLGFSEAQWTTLGIFAVSVVLSLYGLLPHYSWHLWALPALTLVMVAVVVVRRLRPVPTDKILHPKHILELAEGLEVLESRVSVDDQVFMFRTSLGLNISRGMVTDAEEFTIHYTFSGERIKKGKKKDARFIVNENLAKKLGKLIQTFKYPGVPFEIVVRQAGIFHTIFRWHTNGNQKQPGNSAALNLRRDLRHSYN